MVTAIRLWTSTNKPIIVSTKFPTSVDCGTQIFPCFPRSHIGHLLARLRELNTAITIPRSCHYLTVHWYHLIATSPVSPLSRKPAPYKEIGTFDEHSATYGDVEKERPSTRSKTVQPLKDLKVVIIHMKDRLDDGPSIRDIVKEQLDEYEKVENLGVEFIFPYQGDAMYF